ncbi:hypothetical protein SAMN05216474_2151 [Lishizhenia tianjinensis]|uniref:Uncharacterized protein n=1 Tax=Lishizhenia tianjinensis TaxID=477690 RepID=A0A1I7AJD6_9FLAO|nr:hypothetical protein [Lishizhenia tianjinensis]SFT75052.1 hypothetical protein SAMN05216474_2151 [Lishizhenia tianjinensis]
MTDDVMNSEYNNVGELFGIGELERATQGMSPVKKAMFIKRIAGQVHSSRRSRGEMEKFFKQLPKHVKGELLKGGVRLADYTIYSTKLITSKTIKMFEPQDDKEVAVRNISNAKLPKNMVFLVSGIILLTGKIPDPQDKESIKAINFGSVSRVPAIANGEFSLKANRKQIVPENQSIRRFITDNDTTVPLGYYKLDNPRLIRDEELIEFTVELGTMFNIPNNEQYLYIGLDGTGTTP